MAAPKNPNMYSGPPNYYTTRGKINEIKAAVSQLKPVATATTSGYTI